MCVVQRPTLLTVPWRFLFPPPGIQVQRTPAQGFTPKTRNRPCADGVKITHLKPPCHRTGTTTVPRPKPDCEPRYQRIPLLAHQEPHPSIQAGATFPHQAQSRDVSVRWTRAIRSLDPVRGLSPPSIPLPFHWRAGTCSQRFSPRVMEWFFSNEPV